MSFKPSLFSDEGKLLPLANEDELFILERSRISFQVKGADGTYKGKGRVYCTTQRIIFVAEKGAMQNGILFDAFEIPLYSMMDEKFNQPIFGACSISGLVLPSEADTKDTNPYHWKIIFDNGGTGVVLPVFLKLLDKRRREEQIDMNFVQSQQKAFMDPNDPTVIYISQPLRRRQTAGTREAI